MEVIVTYGYNVLVALREFKEKVIKEIEKLTTMNVVDITIVAKGIYMPEEKKIFKLTERIRLLWAL